MSKTIIVADSDESTREALKKILGNIFPMVIVETPSAVRNVLTQKEHPAVLLMGLYEDDAIDTAVFAEIRKDFPALTIIALGDSHTEEHAVAAVREGATGYMLKPFRADELIATVQGAFGKKA